jgi:hypothetical protein
MKKNKYVCEKAKKVLEMKNERERHIAEIRHQQFEYWDNGICPNCGSTNLRKAGRNGYDMGFFMKCADCGVKEMGYGNRNEG